MAEGTAKYTNGDSFIGTFYDTPTNDINCGTKTYFSKSVYQGEFLDNKRHGKGHLLLSNKQWFEGVFEKGNFVKEKKTTCTTYIIFD